MQLTKVHVLIFTTQIEYNVHFMYFLLFEGKQVCCVLLMCQYGILLPSGGYREYCKTM